MMSGKPPGGSDKNSSLGGGKTSSFGGGMSGRAAPDTYAQRVATAMNRGANGYSGKAAAAADIGKEKPGMPGKKEYPWEKKADAGPTKEDIQRQEAEKIKAQNDAFFKAQKAREQLGQKAHEQRQQQAQKANEERQRESQKAFEEQQRQNQQFFDKQNKQN